MGKFLITYCWQSIRDSEYKYGYDIADDPIEWIHNVQKYLETYILINAQPMTDEQALKYAGTFKGM